MKSLTDFRKTVAPVLVVLFAFNLLHDLVMGVSSR